MNQAVSPTRRLSPALIAVVMIALLLSLVSIYLGLNEYLVGDSSTASFYMSIGMVTLALSTYMLYQTRRRMIRLISLEMQPLSSTVQCQKCGFKNVREFQRGDFVFKETEEKCPKDETKMKISSIYREVKDKEKAKESSY
ncbi:MAG TPA: hypothetical protein VJ249_03600 [Candidatus Bathyarchaeia archaeon]|nr:hypothetical protein [Candidatus Bathyarchaeia archaeon]